MENLQYPIGQFDYREYTFHEVQVAIDALEVLPKLLKESVSAITEKQLDTPYRPNGWTARQVIHHMADSHTNMYVRVKLALTEENPRISPYEEQLWAGLSDYMLPIESSLQMIEAIHLKLVNVLKSLSEKDFEKMYFHPQNGNSVPVRNVIHLYKWHGLHHLEHIKLAMKNA
ncbi:MAG: YfiT family bacillithiol transferase [Leadbetterella sp.]